MYTADHNFYKQLLRGRFTFSHILFEDTIKHITTLYKEWATNVYSSKVKSG